MWYRIAQQLQLPGLDVEQSTPKEKILEPKDKIPEPLETEKNPKSLFFSDWAEGYKVPTQPVYHGTTKNFDIFDINKGMQSNAFGPGFYFTSDEKDASENYTGAGPDQIRNIENIQYDLMDQNDEDEYYLFNLYGDDPRYSKYFLEDGTTYNPQILTEAIAKDIVLGENNPRVIPAHIRMKNPIHLTDENDEEHPEHTFVDDVDGNTEFLDEINIDTSDSNSYKAVIAKLYNILMDYIDSDEAFRVCEELVDETTGSVNGKVSAVYLMDSLRNKLQTLDSDYDTDYKGEIIKRFLNELGFDSIVMDPNLFFRMYSNKDRPMKHYITWDPENIKHARENIEFDPKNPVITANSGRINLWKNSLL